MATITVTNLNDSGAGSLRAAIAGAAAGDIVTFAPGLSGGVIRLASTLSVPVNITIDGDLNNDGRPDITISGDVNNDDVPAAGSTTISDIVASAAAGKISDNVRVLSATGDITIDGLIITGGNATGSGGGGVYAGGSLFVASSLIAGNTANQGGGLFANFGTANITASTLSGNSATGFGNAAAFGNVALNLTNVTATGNTTAGRYALSSNGSATVVNSTVTGNTAQFGALIATGGTLTITNSISVANQGGDAASNAPIVYTGLNIIGIGGDTNGADGRINAPSLGAVFASVAANPFSGVTSGVLTDSGSGVPTVALNPSATNPALDASNASAPATDARATARQDLVSLGNNGSNFADLGAFEVTDQAPVINAVPLLANISEDASTATAIKVSTLSVVDADGNNTLSLSGADAALFEIQADGIYLKSGTVLDFETNPVLDVTLDVVTLGFGTNSDSASINVTDVDELPLLTGVAPSVTFGENTVNTTPQLIDASVTLTDPEGNFNGGMITVSGLLGEDSVAIRNQGTAAGQIGVSGSNVTFGNTVIGTFAGGSGTTLTVTFNGSATAAAIEALIENLTYANSSNTPTASRTLTLSVTDSGLRFIEATGAANPFNGINGAYTPALADVDGDGDLDLVASGTGSTLKYYQNTGSTAAPVYVALTGADNPFDAIDVGTPAFGDVDGDGDLDLVVGDSFGDLKYYKNTGSAIAPVYVELTGADSPVTNLGVPFYSTPTLADADGDGDLDLVVGEQDGFVNYFRNTGSVTAPVFVGLQIAGNPFTTIRENTYTSPALGDVDGDGDLDLVVGDSGSILNYYRNNGSAIAPSFVEQTGTANPFGNLDVGRFQTPILVDVDGDGDLDLVVGSDRGTLQTFLNGVGATVTVTVNVTPENDAPTLNRNTGLTMAEGGSSVILASKLGYSDIEQTDDQLVYTITSQTAGTVVKSNVVLATGQTFTQLDIDGGLIEFHHDGSEGASAGFAFSLSDGTATINSSFDITVTPVNDAPTEVSFTNAVTAIAENTLTQVKLADIGITDVDGGTNTLSLSGADANVFEIIGGSLFLKAGTALDFETKKTYAVTVNVDDATVGAAPDAFANFALAVTDVNEAPTAVTLSNAVTTLAENTSTGSRIKIADIAVTDDALGSETITLAGADSSLFEIFDDDLYLKASATLDFETNPSLDVTVNVDDSTVGAAIDATRNLSVTVTDVNEAPTAVTLTNQVTSLGENTSTASRMKIADITVTDDALGTETLAVTGADASSFEIFDGDLYLKQGVALNFEAKASYAVAVTVNDASVGATPDATSGPIALAVTDVNEAPTALAFSNTLASIAENASTAARRKVADITITDDALGTETITLTGADASKFEIFDGDLYLKAGATLDFETNPKLDVTVNVDDTTIGSGIELSRALSVTVTDVFETISGSSSSNTLTGTSGADRINAGAGNDTVNGGAGDDIIYGGAGIDRLTGGTGRDTFVFKSITESGYRASGSLTEGGPLTDQAAIGQRDIITDFTPGTDKIDLSDIDANTNLSGNQAFTFRGTGALSSAGSLVYRKFDNAGTASDRTIIFADVTGDGRSDFQIELTGLKTLAAGDFVL